MPLVIDPAGSEVRALQNVIHWKKQRVLEIGCGEGRLTLRLAAFGPSHIEAIDPDVRRVRAARKNLPVRQARRISYHVGHAEHLRYPAVQFDVVVFAWAL
jgi:ubiquinone/menaquinone biosynthesis C-methylase UbiE